MIKNNFELEKTLHMKCFLYWMLLRPSFAKATVCIEAIYSTRGWS